MNSQVIPKLPNNNAKNFAELAKQLAEEERLRQEALDEAIEEASHGNKFLRIFYKLMLALKMAD